MGHIPGSRKSKVHECYDSKGPQAAIALAEKLGLAPTTARSWINTWRKGSNGTPVVNKKPRFHQFYQTVPIEKKVRPRGIGVPINVRLQPGPLSMLDVWRSTQPDLPSRAEALRQLMMTHHKIRKVETG